MENQDWAFLSVLWLIVGYVAVLTVLTSSALWAGVVVLVAGIAFTTGAGRRMRRSRSTQSFAGGLTDREG